MTQQQYVKYIIEQLNSVSSHYRDTRLQHQYQYGFLLAQLVECMQTDSQYLVRFNERIRTLKEER